MCRGGADAWFDLQIKSDPLACLPDSRDSMVDIELGNTTALIAAAEANNVAAVVSCWPPVQIPICARRVIARLSKRRQRRALAVPRRDFGDWMSGTVP